MLVFQHPQFDERKVSTRLGAFTNHATGARQWGSKGPGIPPPLQPPPHPNFCSGSPQKAARTEKARCSPPGLNFPDTLQTTFKLPGPYQRQRSQVRIQRQPSCPLSNHSACLFISTFRKTIISKRRHLWEQPLASCPALCNQPVLTPTGEEETALVNPLVYQALFPGCSRETNCCSRKSSRKPLAPGGSSLRLLPSTEPRASTVSFSLPF